MRAHPMKRRLLVMACAVSLVAGACSSGGGGDDAGPKKGSDTTSSGDGGGSTAAATKIPGSGRAMPGGKPMARVSSIVQSAYYWSGDDDGEKPGDAAEMVMVFEPTGDADLIVQDPENQLTINGDWTYEGGKLSLSFDDEQFATDSSFALDLKAEKVTMPFRLLSGGAEGKSTWIRGNADPMAHLDNVFRVATLGRDEADGDAGVARAADFANEVVRLRGKPSNLRAAPGAAPTISNVTPQRGGVEIEYSDGTKVTQLLYAFAAAPTSALTLGQAPLASDPRTHLPTKPSGNTAGDPKNKTALFVGTLESRVVYSWYDGVVNGGKNTGVLAPVKDAFDWSGMESALEDRDYDVTQLMDEKATTVEITKALQEDKGPGVIVMNTHGSAGGSLMTRDLLLEPKDTAAAYADGTIRQKLDAALDEVRADLRANDLGDLVSYRNGAALGIFGVPVGLMTGGQAWYVGLTPVYWDYLREKGGVDLSKSLVYLGACDVDQSDLRDHVRAASLWAYRLEVAPQLAGAMAKYLVQSVAKPTWTAEEAFYNAVRVVNTKQMTYQHDKVLDGVVPADASGKSPLFDPNQTPLSKGFMLNAYGYAGGKAVPYAGNGWLQPGTHDVAQIWWMMWAARWGQDSAQGSKNLGDCWAQFWSKGTRGGLASPFCNAANVGSTPTDPEVRYARFLLTGDAPPAQAPPRWTLNESP
jgi:hypothetical protein